MTNLAVEYGNITFETVGPMTIDDVTNLARAGEIAGIPNSAIIVSMNFYWHGDTAKIQIGWQMPR